MKTTLLIPVLNEREGMKAILPQIPAGWVDQVLVVDGGSSDGSAELAREMGLRVFRQKRRGLRFAYEESYDLIEGEVVILFSPDGNCLPEKIPALIEKMRGGYDMVVVSRYLSGARSEDDDCLTGFGNWFFTWLINVLFGGRHTDSLGIFRAFRKSLIEELGIRGDQSVLSRWGIIRSPLSWEVQLSVRCAERRLRVGEIPGDEPPRLSGKRKMRPFRDGLVILCGIFRERFLMMRRAKERAAFSSGLVPLVFPICFFLWFSLKNIQEQGVYLDVALFALPGLGIYSGFPWTPSLRVLGLYFPLMTNQYNGAWEGLAALPWVYLFGPTALAANLASVFFGLLGLLALYGAAGVLYGGRFTPFLAVFLLATAPSYVAASRLGLYTGVLTCSFAMAGLGCLFRFYETRGKIWLVSGAFFLGLGLGCRVQFLCFVAALGLSVLVLDRRAFLLASPRTWFLSAGAFLIGILPHLVANARNSFFTLSFLADYARLSRSGISNLHYFGNLRERIVEFWRLLDGSAFSPIQHPNHWMGIWLCAVLVIFLLRGRFSKRALLPWAVGGIFLLQSPFTPTGLDPHHLIILTPLAALALAGTLSEFFGRASSRPVLYLLSSLGLVAGGMQLRIFYLDRPHLSLHGGHEVRWNLAGELVDWLNRSHIDSVGLGDTGLMDPLLYLSGGKIRVREIFWAPYLGGNKEERLESLRRRLLEEQEGFYVFRSAPAAMTGFYEDFRRIALEAGKSLRAEKTVSTPRGEPVFVVYRLSS